VVVWWCDDVSGRGGQDLSVVTWARSRLCGPADASGCSPYFLAPVPRLRRGRCPTLLDIRLLYVFLLLLGWLHLFHYLLNTGENPRIDSLVWAVAAAVALLLEGVALVFWDP
jgi:hypothetical protein